ncbi:neuronal acetylcholine receptor subunit non-alpha-2 isoform X2 [Lingula anatina]|uniref:Neuronal acetylcholine receptor subunit non-alpha-2 isoform X2 n=1 Tax=Lingula anatina TaxID=7574 RepID=A0A1S3I418_LINAN|nr:neuronal acetylcholine receptor subunit non-alpha-2 isoform X2 [Lingula anatina]|eukprot:XP_013393012.1 neuronal acetylcholine receptor subunit non-alpha-2 isoform X2 [Lingula anatina]
MRIPIQTAMTVLQLAGILSVSGADNAPHRSRRIRKGREIKIPDEQRLLRNLLYKYDTASRPVYNASHTVTVKYGLTLTQIADMDEVNQVLTTNVWLEQEWVDERLKWNPADYNNLVVMRMPCEKIWLPDIVLYNSADDYTAGYMQSKAMVDHNGTVFWPPPAKFRSSCKIDITFFPFDDQVCKMKFGSWAYDGFQLNMTSRNEKVDMSNYVFSGEWDLLSIDIVRNEKFYGCCPEPYPDVTFYLRIRRRTLYYLINVIFPCLWLSILSLLGFWLPPDSGEKITLGITVLLAFSVFMLLIAENMPATSDFVPLIGIYLTMTMAMTSLSIVLTVFVLQLHHASPNQKPVPEWVKRIVFGVLARITGMRGAITTTGPYHLHDDIVKDDVCLTTFLENDNNENATCNGGFQIQVDSVHHNNASQDRLNRTHSMRGSLRHLHNNHNSENKGMTYDKISKHLKLLVQKQDFEDQYLEIVNEWRLVACVIDRFLFWTFLLITTVSTLTILVIVPIVKNSSF